MLTIKKVKEMDACQEALDWAEPIWNGNEENEIKVLKRLMKEKKYDWANWLIVRVMTRPRYLAYAIYGAEQVIGIYEKKYPNEDSPRKAIEAAKAVLSNDNETTRAAAGAAARAAGDAAWAAGDAAWAAGAAARAARDAAWTARAAEDAAGAAGDAAWAAGAAARAAGDAAEAAWDAAEAATRKKMQIKILKHGIKLLEVATADDNHTKRIRND